MKWLLAILAIGICFVVLASATLLWMYPSIENYPRQVRHTETALEYMDQAVFAFLEDTGRFPRNLTELIDSGSREGWNGPYINPRSLVDAWNNPFFYAVFNDQEGYLLLSTGKNGKLWGQGEESVIFSPQSGPASNKGFNRTPESSGPAKPDKSGGGAG